MSEKILIAPAGWEERFIKGVNVDIDEFKPSKILVIFSEKYATKTEIVRNQISDTAKCMGIDFLHCKIDYIDEVKLYHKVVKLLSEYVSDGDEVLLNATTTPRNLIWYILNYLANKKIATKFSYFRPNTYSEHYLSRDAKEPRYVLKCSGIAYPDLPTCILVLSGYDEERLLQLKQRYEPKMMLVGRQIGDQYKNKERNYFNKHEQADMSYFDFDCYDTSQNAVNSLIERIIPLKNNYNVVAASLGPKPCALTLFKLILLMPEIGLVYIPAGEYSDDYSSGVDLDNRVLENLIWQ